MGVISAMVKKELGGKKLRFDSLKSRLRIGSSPAATTSVGVCCRHWTLERQWLASQEHNWAFTRPLQHTLDFKDNSDVLHAVLG